MAYKLVALDLDGTLLDSQHRLSPANRQAVQDCTAHGVAIVVATGRPFTSTSVYCRELGLMGPQITLNGAVIYEMATERMRPGPTIAPTTVHTITTTLTELDIPFVVFGRGTTYALPDTPHVDVLVSYGDPPALLVPVINATTVPDPTKVLAFVAPSGHDVELAEQFRGQADVVRSAPFFLEFLTPGISKGAALRQLMDEYGVTADEVLAVGDSFNDISMFEVAGMSVAMGGAAAAVQAHTQATTSACNADGVAEALERFVLGPARAVQGASER